MANKFYNKQTTTSLKGEPPAPSHEGPTSAAVPMRLPKWPKGLGGEAGHWRGLKGAEVCPCYPESDGLN